MFCAFVAAARDESWFAGLEARARVANAKDGPDAAEGAGGVNVNADVEGVAKEEVVLGVSAGAFKLGGEKMFSLSSEGQGVLLLRSGEDSVCAGVL